MSVARKHQCGVCASTIKLASAGAISIRRQIIYEGVCENNAWLNNRARGMVRRKEIEITSKVNGRRGLDRNEEKAWLKYYACIIALT